MDDDIASRFVGTWRLVSYSAVTSSGETTYPMGRNPHGRITYEAGGRMAVQIADPGRAAFAASDPCAATDAEVRAAFDGYNAYYGSYTVQADPGVVVHHLEMSLIPNWAGGDQVRYFDLQGGLLTLKTPPMPLGGVELVASLVWEKLP
jgi:hypothetical protein